MKLLHEVCASMLGLPAETFIYNIAQLQSANSSHSITELSFVASSSNDALTVFSISQSNSKYVITPISSVKNAHKGLSCLQSTRLHSLESPASGRSVISAGRDALVKIWALSTQLELSELLQLRVPSDIKHQGFSAIAQSEAHALVAAGTELETDGPGDVSVYIWKVQNAKNTNLPILAFKESHTDTVTNLSFQPSAAGSGLSSNEPVNLVSSSTDGLVNVFDLEQQDEDDAVLAVINTRSAVQYMLCANSTGGAFSETANIWTVSQDEKLAYNSLSDVGNLDPPSQQDKPQEPVDLRELLHCDYTISLKKFEQGAGTAVLAVGGYKSDTATEPRVDLYFLSDTLTAPGSDPGIRLSGAHGEEIVRDVWYTEDSPLIVTCGEDSYVRVWLDPNANTTSNRARDTNKKNQRSKEGPDVRFRPY